MNWDTSARFTGRRGNCLLVEFKGNRRELFNNCREFPFRRGDIAIVEAERGQDAGVVRYIVASLMSGHPESPPLAVIRRASAEDMERLGRLRDYEQQAIAVCRKRIASHDLPMKLVDAEYRFDGLKLTFYFTADRRVDFRDLVRDLASTFRTRIELRQIGARDEVRRWDGLGSCGKRLCCVSHIRRFQPITTHMAKVQNLILNPSKLSGLCGRLRCCLAFEYERYVSEAEVAGVQAAGQADEMMDEELSRISD